MPYIATAHELKTKPMQHSVRELRAIGIHPHVLLCRTDRYLSPDIKAKLALYCDVPEEAVITAKDVDSIYEVPLVLSGEGLDAHRPEVPGPARAEGRDMAAWERLVDRIKNPKGEVVIGIVGKYVSFEDSYKSLNEALTHGGFAQRRARGAALGGGRGARGGERRGEARRRRRHPGARAASARGARGA